MSKRTRFLTIGLQRSGTTVTHLAFRGHPNVSALSDELTVDPFFSAGIDVFTVSQNNEHEKRFGYGAMFDAMTLMQLHDGSRAADQIFAHGAKATARSVAEAQTVVGTLRNFMPDVKVVRVRRRDTVALLASRMRAERTGQWHSWNKDGEATGSERFAIPTDKMERFHREATAIETALDTLGESHDVCTMDFENDISSTSPQRFGPMFEAVGVPALEPTWLRSSKVAPPLEDFVENLDELRAHLADLG